MKRIMMVAAGLLAAGTTQSAGLYKCTGADGKVTYSQVQCPDNPTPVAIYPSGKRRGSGYPFEEPERVRPATQEEIDRCFSTVKAVVKYKDPESVRFEGDQLHSVYSDGHHEVVLQINAKNSWGAYAGSKVSSCRYHVTGDLYDLYNESN